MNDSTQLEFLDQFGLNSSVKKIKILGHTGRSIDTPIQNFANLRQSRDIRNTVTIQLLLRDPGSEFPKRRNQIVNSIRNFERLNKEFEWLNIEIRCYTAIQTLRGAIIELNDKTIFTYFSGYHWGFPDPSKTSNPHPIKTSAVKWGTIINSAARKEEKDNLARLIENWFDYYWGPGVIHSIAFDFDDTIVDTYNDKIEAWICAIDATLAIPDYVKWFTPVFIESYGNNARDKFEFVKNVVDDYAEKEGILPHILVNTAPPVVSEFLEKKRSAYRSNALFPRNKTKQELSAHIKAKLFKDVGSVLDSLVRNGYSVSVASLTDEDRIERTLQITKITCVDTIVGRNEYSYRELGDRLTSKIYLIRKIANLAGIPVSRVLYIGDHRGDEAAANEVGASFIQARLMADIKASDDPETLYFEEYVRLRSVVEEAESRARARDLSPHQPKHYV